MVQDGKEVKRRLVEELRHLNTFDILLIRGMGVTAVCTYAATCSLIGVVLKQIEYTLEGGGRPNTP